MQYAGASGIVTCARPEATFTTRPRLSRNAGSAAAVTRHGPRRLTSSTRSASSAGRSPALCGSPIPAQLMRTSSPPRRATASATARSTDTWSRTSQVRMSSSPLTSRPTTRAPPSRSALTVARPMPPAAPVMRMRALTRPPPRRAQRQAPVREAGDGGAAMGLEAAVPLLGQRTPVGPAHALGDRQVSDVEPGAEDDRVDLAFGAVAGDDRPRPDLSDAVGDDLDVCLRE